MEQLNNPESSRAEKKQRWAECYSPTLPPRVLYSLSKSRELMRKMWISEWSKSPPQTSHWGDHFFVDFWWYFWAFWASFIEKPYLCIVQAWLTCPLNLSAIKQTPLLLPEFWTVLHWWKLGGNSKAASIHKNISEISVCSRMGLWTENNHSD